MSNDTPNPAEPSKPEIFLYRQPELLSPEAHGALGLGRPKRPFDFAKSARVMPLTLAELRSAQMYYPVVFSETETPVPIAVVGGTDDVNLFVDEQGQWASDTYIPAYARRYPFALAATSKDQYALVFDSAADIISDTPEHAFFDSGKITSETQSIIDFCSRYDVEQKKTVEFGQRLSELSLLTHQEATRTPPGGGEPQNVASYLAVDADKLGELDAGTVHELLQNGYLAGILAHLFSLENWQRLLERRLRREPRAAV